MDGKGSRGEGDGMRCPGVVGGGGGGGLEEWRGESLGRGKERAETRTNKRPSRDFAKSRDLAWTSSPPEFFSLFRGCELVVSDLERVSNHLRLKTLKT